MTKQEQIEEVRKETAKEILQKLIEKQHKRLLAWEYGEGYLDCMKDLKEVINEFGVEVEE